MGGAVRKDVSGYDLKSLLIGSEGTLGIVTSSWLRLVPAPEAAFPIAALYSDQEAGVAAVEAVLGNGVSLAALEYLDGGSMSASAATFPSAVPPETKFAVIGETDGSLAEATALAEELKRVLSADALSLHAPRSRADIERLWRWRDGVSLAVTSQRGGKVSEDIVVPVDRLGEALEGAAEIARAHELESCSWGHAGDGNLHATFLIDPADSAELDRATKAAQALFALAINLGGTISGEHGVGYVKGGQLARQWSPRAVELHEALKQVFDPMNLLNPGKKVARWTPTRSETSGKHASAGATRRSSASA